MLWPALALLLLIAGLAAPERVYGASAVQTENALPGTPGWTVPAATEGAIEGYSSKISVAPGETLGLHVSTLPPARYRVEVYRLGWYEGAGARRMLCLPSCEGDVAGVARAVPAPDPLTGEVDAGWPQSQVVQVGSEWVSGYYVAQLVLTSGGESGRGFTVPFVVRQRSSEASTPVLVQAAVTTWQAYNPWGGKSLYDFNSTGGVRASHVSFNRPLLGESTTQGQEVFSWEYQLVRFLEREGVDVSYATDVDTHRTPSSLLGRRLVVAAGHDEYWSREIRDAFESARDAGVNIAVMGANTGYWQVRFQDGERTMVGYKSAAADPESDPSLETVQFRDLVPARPECQLMGVQYSGGFEPVGVRRDLAVVAEAMAHPWLASSGFSANANLPWSVGYEWDTLQPGCAEGDLTLLFRFQGQPVDAHSVLVRFASGARVFSAGSLQVAWLLDDWVGDNWFWIPHQQDARYQAFMRALLADLAGPAGEPDTTPPALTAGTPANGATDVAPGTDRIDLTFSEPIANVDTSDFTLMNGSTVGIAGIEVSAEPPTVRLSLSSGLAAATSYTLTVGGDITDLAGNPLAESTVGFRTAAGPPPPSPPPAPPTPSPVPLPTPGTGAAAPAPRTSQALSNEPGAPGPTAPAGPSAAAPGAPSPTCRGRAATIVGTLGDDLLRGTGARDVIVGLGGDDRILGGGGADLICAGAGRDTVVAGSGHDTVVGQRGRDVIRGRAGRDLLLGGRGTDSIHGGAGPDTMRGGPGNDRLFGGAGRDRGDGGGGADRLAGGPGADRLRGGRERDVLNGNAGRDLGVGGPGVDRFRSIEIRRT